MEFQLLQTIDGMQKSSKRGGGAAYGELRQGSARRRLEESSAELALRVGMYEASRDATKMTRTQLLSERRFGPPAGSASERQPMALQTIRGRAALQWWSKY